MMGVVVCIPTQIGGTLPGTKTTSEGSSLLAPPSCCAVDDVIVNCTASADNISPQVPLQYKFISQCV